MAEVMVDGSEIKVRFEEIVESLNGCNLLTYSCFRFFFGGVASWIYLCNFVPRNVKQNFE